MRGHTHDRWADRLSEYLDGELSARERRKCEEHLARCADCATALDELGRVIARAESMKTAREPRQDLWPGIAKRLASDQRPAASRLPGLVGWWRPQLAAAGLIVVACLAGALWMLHARPDRSAEQVTAPPSAASQNQTEREYEKTVANLDRQAHDRLTLDPHLVSVLDENLATLDAAIATYRDALAEDPADERLRSRLRAARQKKLEVLQQAVTLASEGAE
jgi:anti-sigma factor RsiW